MTSYGWTLNQVLDLTLPQAKMLIREMGDVPPLPVLLKGLMGKEQDVDTAAPGLAEKAPAAGKAFWDSIGAEAPEGG